MRAVRKSTNVMEESNALRGFADGIDGSANRGSNHRNRIISLALYDATQMQHVRFLVYIRVYIYSKLIAQLNT